MERQIAAELMQEVLKLTAQLNVIIHKVEAISVEADRKELRSHMGPMMAACD